MNFFSRLNDKLIRCLPLLSRFTDGLVRFQVDEDIMFRSGNPGALGSLIRPHVEESVTRKQCVVKLRSCQIFHFFCLRGVAAGIYLHPVNRDNVTDTFFRIVVLISGLDSPYILSCSRALINYFPICSLPNLLFRGDWMCKGESLTIPHPENFCLTPLSDIVYNYTGTITGVPNLLVNHG